MRLFVLTLITLTLFLSGPRGLSQERPELVVQSGHSQVVRSVAFSSDGKILASGGDDYVVKMWDLATGAELRTLRGHTFKVDWLAFIEKGKIIVSADYATVRFWIAATGQEMHVIKDPDGIMQISISPDGQTLATVNWTSKTIKIRKASTGEVISTLITNTSAVTALAFSPDGKTLASGSDKAIQLWNITTAASARTLRGHIGKVTSLSFSPNGKTLASGSDDLAIKMWDVTTGNVLRTMTGHGKTLNSISFSPDGRILGSSGVDEFIKLWDTSNGGELGTVSRKGFGRSNVAFSPDGTSLASGSSYSVKLWGVPSGVELRTFEGRSAVISSVSFSPDGKTLAVSRWSKTIKLWNFSTGAELSTLKGESIPVQSVKFSPDGKTIASAGYDGIITLWDFGTGKELRLLKGHKGSVSSVAFSGDGKFLASGSSDHTIKIWDVAAGSEVRTIEGDLSFVEALAFSPDGRTLAADSFSGVKLWDFSSGVEVRTLKGHGQQVTSIAFSPDGKLLYSGSEDQTVRLWDLWTGSVIHTFDATAGRINAVALTADGRTLACSTTDNIIKVWDVQSKSELRTIDAAMSQSITFSPDNKTLAGGSRDGRINLWDVNSGNKLLDLISLDQTEWVVVTPDGHFDGSKEGMKLVFYVQDNKPISLDSFFDQFYTPQLLRRIYSRESAQVNAPKVDFSKRIRLPPVVHITSPKPGMTAGSDTTQIVVDAQDQGGGVEEIRLYQNGKLISDHTRQLTRATATNTTTFDVTLVPGINTFRATAFNTDRTEATTDEITIDLKAAEASSNLYILAIGLNEYKNAGYNLNYGRADAQSVADEVEQRGRRIFKEIKKRIILDADATRSNIEAAFAEIIKQAKPQDAFVFYYAGHGIMSESDDKNLADFYLVLFDVVRIYGDDESLATNGIAARNLREMLKNVRAQKQLIILDACESGGALETIATRGASEEKAIMQLARSAGVAVLASAGQDQLATEFGKLGHGVFTYALLKALGGEADGSPKDGKITVKELEAYLNDQVPELTKRYRGKRQDPNSWTRGQDFPIAIR
jgi:WD40 repeat protein